MISRLKSWGFVLVVATAALSAASVEGCANQGVGQVCNTENGNADCESGLICRSKADLKSPADICCPEGATDEQACTIGGLAGATGTGTGTGTGGGSSTSTGTGQGGGATTGTGGAGGSGGGM